MTPEEFYYQDKLKNLDLFEVRLKSLEWVLDCFNRGSIRKRTIVNLIPKKQLEHLLQELEDSERYEDCIMVKQMLDIVYKQNPSKNE